MQLVGFPCAFAREIGFEVILMLRGSAAQDLMAEVLDASRPHLPPGVAITMTRHKRWLSLQRAGHGSKRIGALFVNDNPVNGPIAAGTGVPGVGPWVPFLPSRLRVKMTIQDAVETVLGIAFTNGHQPDVGFVVRVAIEDGVALAFYLPVGGREPADRITLAPIITAF